MPEQNLIEAACTALPELSGKAWVPLSGGQTNRLWLVGDIVVKSYPAKRSTPLFPNDPSAEAAALRHFAPLGLAPEGLAGAPDWIAYRYVTGTPWAADTAIVARLLARLHTAPMKGLSFRAIPSGGEALLTQTRALCDAAGIAPDFGPAPDVSPCLPRPLHGDAVAGNLIVTNTGAMLIDWQCPALGDPVEDIAMFLSPAMQVIYRGHPLTRTEEEDFLTAYPDRETVARFRSLRPLLHTRMLAHCVWRANRGDAGYARAAEAEKARL